MTDARTEKRIANLLAELRALKVSYPVAAALVSFRTPKTSQAYSRSGGGNNNIVVRVKYTMKNPPANGRTLTRLTPKVFIDSGLSQRWPRYSFVTEPQAGDGSVVVCITIATTNATQTYYFNVTASSPFDGDFSIL